MGLVELTKNLGRNLTFIKPHLLRGYTLLQWMHHRRKKVLRTVDGITYELDLNEVIDSAIYFLGAFEPDTAAAFKRLVRPGDVVLDVGANVGSHSLLFSKLVGPCGRVVAFEPTRWAFRKLQRNKDLNLSFCSENLILEKLVVADHSGISQTIRFQSRWPLFGVSAPSEEEIVDSVTVDDYVENAGLTRVDFLKVDVDGYEYKVIRGAKRKGPRLVAMNPFLCRMKRRLPEASNKLPD